MPAKVKILVEGYTNADSIVVTGEEKTCPTISLVRDGDLVMVVDPGVLESQQILVDALAKEGLRADDVNMVCITHSHIDHYRNIGMFPNAKTLEYFGVWDKNTSKEWQEQFTVNIQILKTPGHDYTGITLFVKTDDGVVAVCGDVFWKENFPEEDQYALDLKKLAESRNLVLEKADWIVPGHAGIYKAKKSQISKEKKSVAKEIKFLGACRRCHRPFKKAEDRCECRPSLCYHCCECDMDCGLCNCKHKR